jgi:hypothetical protein
MKSSFANSIKIFGVSDIYLFARPNDIVKAKYKADHSNDFGHKFDGRTNYPFGKNSKGRTVCKTCEQLSR